MIRINLLPDKGKRRAATGNLFLIVGAALAVAEIGGLFLWHQVIDEEVQAAEVAAKDEEAKLKKAQEAKKSVEDLDAKKLELNKQNIIFEQLESEKTGVPSMLLFLCYLLSKKEFNEYSRDEIDAQEAIGWATQWDADRVWLNRIEQDQQWLTIQGLAKDHEDVSEFARRLESGIYFVDVWPKTFTKVADEEFRDVKLVAFEVTAFFNYSSEGQLQMLRGDVPLELEPFLVQEAPPPPEPSKDKKKGKEG
jgi:Tfp pilus assembly protein PilN